jgi:putative addiction module component (TIGR02574 family)
MSLTLDQLREEVLALSPQQRQELIASTEPETEPLGLHPAWKAEIARRMQSVRDGTAELIPSEEVDREMDELVNGL